MKNGALWIAIIAVVGLARLQHGRGRVLAQE